MHGTWMNLLSCQDVGLNTAIAMDVVEDSCSIVAPSIVYAGTSEALDWPNDAAADEMTEATFVM